MLPFAHARIRFLRRRRFDRAVAEEQARAPSSSAALTLLRDFETSPLSEFLDCQIDETDLFKRPAVTAALYYYYQGAARCAVAYVEATQEWPNEIPDVALTSLPSSTRRRVEDTLRIDTALRVIGSQSAVRGSLSRLVTLAFELRAPRALASMHAYVRDLGESVPERWRKLGALDFLTYLQWLAGPRNRAAEDFLWDGLLVATLFGGSEPG